MDPKKIKYVTFFLFLSLVFPFQVSFADIAGTRHDLSFNNPNKAAYVNIAAANPEDNQICKFCHIPHGAQVVTYSTYTWYKDAYGDNSFDNKPWRLPLISHVLTSTGNFAWVSTYDFSMYLSTWTYPGEGRFQEDPDNYPEDPYIIAWQPSGAAKVCFSCHDGTVAIGSLVTGTIDVAEYGSTGKLNDGKLNWDGDVNESATVYRPNTAQQHFANRHGPALVSRHGFYSHYVTQEVINDHNVEPTRLAVGYYLYSNIDTLKPYLDRNQFMQCTTCHDPHSSDDADDPALSRQFWRYPDTAEVGTCNKCHY